MLFSTFRSLTIAALFIVFVAGARSQTVVTNNLVQSSSDPVQNWSSILKVGQSFTANASGNLSSISLNLTTSNNSATPVYAVELWSDNGQSTHLPSTLLATFVSSQNWNTVYSAAQNPTSTITFNSSGFGQNYSISSGTTYWIVVSSTAGSAKAWGVRSGSDIGDTATYAALSGPWSSASLAGSLGMSLSVQSAIPEPGTYALFAGLCTLGVTIVLRRRRHPRLPTASR